MNKAELKAALDELGVSYPADASNAELEEMLELAQELKAAEDLAPEADALAGVQLAPEGDDAPAADPEDAPAADTGQAPEADAEPDLVRCVVKPGGPAGRIIVNRIPVGVNEPGWISRVDFDRLKQQYRLEEIPE